MKLGHGYFKFYLNRLPDYNSDKCHWPCHQKQTPEHLLTTCHHFKQEQLVLRKKLEGLPLGIRTLFTIKEEIQAVLHLFIYLFFIRRMQPIRLWRLWAGLNTGILSQIHVLCLLITPSQSGCFLGCQPTL